MATKTTTSEEFNRWAESMAVSSRFDYNKPENRELVRRIQEAKFFQENPQYKPKEEPNLKTADQSILSGTLESIREYFINLLS